MSTIYIQEPPTSGKVLLTTSVGEIEIELWPKEAPRACRNFVQLCLEGLYNNTIFHRIVKGFIAQGGDPTGTGNNGESIYGIPFKNEVHSRLRFNRRGLVATATGDDINDSQFFFTFSPAPMLQNKHTIFGKVVGDTMFNMLKLEEVQTDLDDRPHYPPKIIKAEVLSNPFTDINPRIRSESIYQFHDIPSTSKEIHTPAKNFKLLSFGDEAEEDEEEIININKKLMGKNKSTHDLLPEPHLSSRTALGEDYYLNRQQIPMPSTYKMSTTESVKSKLKLDERDKPECSQAAPKKKIKTDDSDEVQHSVKIKFNVVTDDYRDELKTYTALKKQIPAKGPSRENQTYEMMMKFKERLKRINQKMENNDELSSGDEDSEYWMARAFTCQIQKHSVSKDANKLNDDWYDITDPRNSMNKRRREDSKKVLHHKGK